ncbi:MAG: polyprenol monophosphomannose synthase [Sphingobacteriales bacterium]|nr:MAG: polyprenol monophosphomannose synthase [Sphingobacteriales bacterium]
MPEKLVVIPTYNEKDNIEAILLYVFNMNKDFHILVVDDSSPDGTGEIVRRLQGEYSGLFLEERKGKLGLGTAYIHGFKWGLARNYQFIFEMDADFSHNPDDLERLYHACKYEGGDLAVGSRYVKGGNVENWPWDRNMLSKGGALYTRLITWMPVKDPTAGFMCYKRDVLDNINLDGISFVGYAFQIEMKFAAWKLGYEIREVPITFIDRKLGTSKMHKGIVKEGILGVMQIQWQSMFKNYRQRIRNTANSVA